MNKTQIKLANNLLEALIGSVLKTACMKELIARDDVEISDITMIKPII